jgi:hypothetical protein
MASVTACTPDTFARALTGLLDASRVGVEDELDGAVRKSTSYTRRRVVVHARSAVGDASGDPSWRQGRALEPGERYPAGFSYRVTRKSHGSTGTVGNKTEPGLVHLLEKGHAIATGGRVQAYKHMEPAAEEGFEDFEKRAEEAIGAGLAR